MSEPLRAHVAQRVTVIDSTPAFSRLSFRETVHTRAARVCDARAPPQNAASLRLPRRHANGASSRIRQKQMRLRRNLQRQAQPEQRRRRLFSVLPLAGAAAAAQQFRLIWPPHAAFRRLLAARRRAPTE